jgi:hypothetical protein
VVVVAAAAVVVGYQHFRGLCCLQQKWIRYRQGMRRGWSKVGYSVSLEETWEENSLNRALEKGKDAMYL